MDQDKRLHRKIPLPMRLSMRSDCPYIAGQTEQRIAVDISLDPHCHDGLARAGSAVLKIGFIDRPARIAMPVCLGA
jgi:hypothetical protein